jgi:protein-tyrosine phosphatase
MTTRILAVCAGNICRSPTAAAAISEAADRAGVDVLVDSAGTGAWNLGEPPHHQAVAAAGRVGLELAGRARRVNSADFGRFEIIVVMDRANLRDVLAMAPDIEDRAKVRLFRTYDPDTDSDEIPDPYGGSDEAYDRTVAQVRAAAVGLIDSLAPVTPGT